MGFFDDLQNQQDRGYIKAPEYLEQLAKEHNSTIRATAHYLLHLDPFTGFSDIYCQERGNYVIPSYTDSPAYLLFFNNAIDMHTDEKYVLDEFKKNNSHLYFKKSELLRAQETEVEKENYLSNRNESLADLIEQLADAKITIDQLTTRAETAELNKIGNTNNLELEQENKKLINRLDNAKEVFKGQKSEIDRLTEQVEQSEVKINELIADADIPNDKHLYDWQAMNQYNYPPELHLAILIWEKSYILNEISNRHITDHSQRFNIIAEKIGLDKAIHGGALISRLSKITNPQINKQKSDIENLKIIKELNIKDLDNSNPKG
ncbi:hypothetical protein QL982_05135 [Psychrobacter sp. 5A.1]|uniref:hypothetical protein n=1 Tax=Psychrobacter sp. 5A.1 TaxID=3035207 RepID=UPI0025B2C01B|nr:hypothetical protein [Psychrobacter sp. 5A.1]MDN3502119.1 hypothetical protein [Psychrobacter sp. 5A.1]